MPFVAQPQEKCVACNRTVFATEKMVVEEKEVKKVFHKNCLRCVTCNQSLSLGNYSALEGQFYCKPHFKQLFATKGNYDESFGKEKATNKWEPTATVVSGTKSFIPTEETKVEKTQQTSESTLAKFKKFREEGDSNKCETCDKTVYLAEKLLVEDRSTKRLFHKACFKCVTCALTVDLRSYGSLDGKIFCKNHLKEAQQAQLKEKTQNAYVPTSSTFIPETEGEKRTEKGETPDHIASKFKGLGSSEKCKACGKSVYVTEKIIVEELNTRTPYHKNCLKCSHCNIGLDLSTYGSANGTIYCKVHLKTVAAPEMAKVAIDLDNPLTGIRRVENVDKPSLVPVNREGAENDDEYDDNNNNRNRASSNASSNNANNANNNVASPVSSAHNSHREDEEEEEHHHHEEQHHHHEEPEAEPEREPEVQAEPEPEPEQPAADSSSSSNSDNNTSDEDDVARRRRIREEQERAEEEERQQKLEARRREREERKRLADEEAAREEEERKRRQEERRKRLESSDDN